MGANVTAAWAVITSLPILLWYTSCHGRANGSLFHISAIKIFASCVILSNAMLDVYFMVFIMLDWASILAVHSCDGIDVGFSLNVTLCGFAGPFAITFFLGGMSATATAEKALERRVGAGVAGGSWVGGQEK
jgi:hypothetical protein